MNTSGNKNNDLKEKRSLGEKAVIFLLRYLLPPHRDNEGAAEYLRKTVGRNRKGIDWVVIRPDGLTDELKKSEYINTDSPVRSPIFNAGKVSRINVAGFMVDLIQNEELRGKWKFKMPLVYNMESYKETQ